MSTVVDPFDPTGMDIPTTSEAVEVPQATQIYNQPSVPGIIVEPPTPGMAPEVAQNRAIQYDRALGPDESPGVDTLRQRLTMGQDTLVRQEYALRKEKELLARRADTIKKYMEQRTPGEVRLDEVEYINKVASGELAKIDADPTTYFEARRAQQANAQVTETPNQVARDARNSDPDLFERINDNAQRVQTLREYAKNKLDELQAEWKNTSGLSAAGAYGGALLSPLQWYRQMNVMGRTATSPFFLGSNQREQAEWYYSQDPKLATVALDRALSQLKGQNLITALDFISSIAEHDATTYAWNNLFSALDVAPGVGFVPYKLAVGGTLMALGKAGISRAPRAAAEEAVEANVRAAQAAQDVAEASTRNRGYPTPAPEAEAAGDLRRAAEHSARDEIINRAEQTGAMDPNRALDGLRSYGRALWNPEQIIDERGTKLSNEAAQRLIVGLNEDGEKLLKSMFVDPVRIEHVRAGSHSERVAADEALRIALTHQYNHIADRVLDIERVIPPRIEELPPKIRPVAERAYSLERQIAETQNKEAYTEWLLKRQALNNARIEANKLTGSMLAPDKLNKTGNVVLRKAKNAVEAEEHKRALIKVKAIEKEVLKYEKSLDPKVKDLFNKALLSATDYDAASKKLNVPGMLQRPHGFNLAEGTVVKEADIIKGLGNVKYISIKFGDQSGQLYPTPVAAFNAAVNEMGLRSSNVRIGQQGTGYYIEVQKSLDITNQRVRNELRLETETKGTWLSNWLTNKILSADFKRPKELNEDAKIAVYGTAKLYGQIADMVNHAVGQVPMRDRKPFIEFLEHQRQYFDPVTKERGTFSTNQFDFEKMYNEVHGRFPSEAESVAYWKYVQISNLDKMILDLGIYRDKAIAGMENFRFPFLGESASIGAEPNIEGKLLTAIPVDAARQRNAGFVIWDGEPSAAEHVYYNTRGVGKRIDDLINEGYKIIQLSHYGADDFKAVEGLKPEIVSSRINFVLTKNVESAPLKFQQTPNRPGGHHVYLYEQYVRQPDVRNGTYYGDSTLTGHLTKEQAAEHARDMDYARILYHKIKQGWVQGEDSLNAFVKKKLPYSPEEFKNLFDNGTFSIDAPFLATRQGQRVGDVHKLDKWYGNGVIDITKDPLSLYQSTNLRYALERGERLMSTRKIGTELDPVHSKVPAPMVDPLSTMDRAIKHLATNMHMGDYQVKATERFIAEFGHLLEPTASRLQNDPLNALLNPVWLKDADSFELRKAMAYRDAAMELLRIRNPAAKDYDVLRDKMTSWLQPKLGDKATSKLIDTALYKKITHPIDATKNAVMYYFLMSPRQLWVQAMGSLHVGAVAGPHVALEAVAATTYGRIVRDYTGAKGMLEHAMEDVFKITGGGWKREHFKEAYELGDRLGYFNVDRSYALADAYVSPVVSARRGTLGKAVDFGMMPFRKGEEFVRHMSWWAAYREWRKANPESILSDIDAAKILDRADFMSGRMSHASMASVQHTAFKIPTTFWSYNMRIWEQMWGGELNKKQIAGVMLNYSVMLGAPAGAGIMAFGIPIYEILQNYFIDKGVPVNAQDNLMLDLAMNGLVGVGLEAATGTQFNAPQTFSPSNSKVFVDVLTDKEGWELLLGATGSAFREMWIGTKPFISFLMDTARPPTDREAFQIRQHHFTDWLNKQRGVDQITRAFYALTYGELLSREGGRVSDDKINTTEAIIFGLTGMTPQRIQDAYGTISNKEKLKEVQDSLAKDIGRSYKLFLDSINKGDIDQAEEYQRDIRIAFAMGRFTETQKSATIRRILGDNASLVERVLNRAGRDTETGERIYRAYQRALEGR